MVLPHGCYCKIYSLLCITNSHTEAIFLYLVPLVCHFLFAVWLEPEQVLIQWHRSERHRCRQIATVTVEGDAPSCKRIEYKPISLLSFVRKQFDAL